MNPSQPIDQGEWRTLGPRLTVLSSRHSERDDVRRAVSRPASLQPDGNLPHLGSRVRRRGRGRGGAEVDKLGLDVVSHPGEGPGYGAAEMPGWWLLARGLSDLPVDLRHAGRDPVQVDPGGGVGGSHHDGRPGALDDVPRGANSQHRLHRLLGLVGNSCREIMLPVGTDMVRTM